MVDDIDDAVGGKRADHVFFAFDTLAPYAKQLAGRRVESVEARGKAVLVWFEATASDGSWCVYSHNQLYGQWRIGRAQTAPKSNRQLRFAIHAGKRAARLYSASDIRLARPTQLGEITYLARLGPDILNENSAREAVAAQLDDKRFAGRNLGGLLLDQSFIAGIGNYLRTEILFTAGLAPARRPRDLDTDERRRLINAVFKLIEQAYRLKGITNDTARVAQLKSDGMRYAQYRYQVFARAGKRCYECGATIVKTTVASRRLYYCPGCQGG